MSATGICRDNDAAGGDLIPSQNTVFANGERVIVNGDGVAGHGIFPHIPQTIIAGSKNVVESLVQTVLGNESRISLTNSLISLIRSNISCSCFLSVCVYYNTKIAQSQPWLLCHKLGYFCTLL